MTYKIPTPPIENRETPKSLLSRAYQIAQNSTNVRDITELLSNQNFENHYFSFSLNTKVCYDEKHLFDIDAWEIHVAESGKLSITYATSGKNLEIDLNQFEEICGLNLDSSVPFDISSPFISIQVPLKRHEELAEWLMLTDIIFIWDTKKFIIPMLSGGDVIECYRQLSHDIYVETAISSEEIDVLINH